MLKTRKIRDKLEATHNLTVPVMFKPKGMHWETFVRLVQAEKVANCNSILAMGRVLKLNARKRRNLYNINLSKKSTG